MLLKARLFRSSTAGQLPLVYLGEMRADADISGQQLTKRQVYPSFVGHDFAGDMQTADGLEVCHKYTRSLAYDSQLSVTVPTDGQFTIALLVDGCIKSGKNKREYQVHLSIEVEGEDSAEHLVVDWGGDGLGWVRVRKGGQLLSKLLQPAEPESSVGILLEVPSALPTQAAAIPSVTADTGSQHEEATYLQDVTASKSTFDATGVELSLPVVDAEGLENGVPLAPFVPGLSLPASGNSTPSRVLGLHPATGKRIRDATGRSTGERDPKRFRHNRGGGDDASAEALDRDLDEAYETDCSSCY